MFVCPVRHASNTQRPHHVTHVSNLGEIDLLACGSFLESLLLVAELHILKMLLLIQNYTVFHSQG